MIMAKHFFAKPALMSIPRFAEELGICPRSVRRAIIAGELKVVDVGQRRYVPRSELARITKAEK
jgi:Helix-turn-helix domain